MASIVERPKKTGGITYQVKWRLGGHPPVQTENFADPAAAETFRQLVELHKGQWPPGWVKGQGFVEEPSQPGDMPLLTYAHRYVDRLTGIDDRTREDYRREVRIHFALIHHAQPSGLVVPATIGNLTAEDVADWVRLEEQGPGGSGGRPAAPPRRPQVDPQPARAAVLRRPGRDRRDIRRSARSTAARPRGCPAWMTRPPRTCASWSATSTPASQRRSRTRARGTWRTG
jgi:hypothetical protein